ncbi:MAG: hypothetical protein JXR84_17765 [Anaerolineae bacterium]|nr:hypothetical protein [Anaerolineae bacterium]
MAVGVSSESCSYAPTSQVVPPRPAPSARTESRGTHYREDYPARNDDEWLAWVLLQQGAGGQMTVTKEDVPDAWKPDPTVP